MGGSVGETRWYLRSEPKCQSSNPSFINLKKEWLIPISYALNHDKNTGEKLVKQNVSNFWVSYGKDNRNESQMFNAFCAKL
jgi:hypothetical protein